MIRPKIIKLSDKDELIASNPNIDKATKAYKMAKPHVDTIRDYLPAERGLCIAEPQYVKLCYGYLVKLPKEFSILPYKIVRDAVYTSLLDNGIVIEDSEERIEGNTLYRDKFNASALAWLLTKHGNNKMGFSREYLTLREMLYTNKTIKGREKTFSYVLGSLLGSALERKNVDFRDILDSLPIIIEDSLEIIEEERAKKYPYYRNILPNPPANTLKAWVAFSKKYLR
ncbi:NEQ072 [Nanoarchaeum equitans Kin4-M]|uniref:NEQ072 n=1 Tax=Nanoarchaeum equitans (strain Kin4-M) TaxID=228908 RepID=Q74N71_NANEQ|nr:NEQ072 [Nanoarchaeum equitans Kin4-M]